MSSEENTLYDFHFKAQGSMGDFVSLKLFNACDKLVISAYGELNTKLKKGLYKLHIEFNETLTCRTYRVDKDTQDTWFPDKLYTSIPNFNIASSHEYYSGTAATQSVRITVKSSRGVQDSSLYIYFRYPDKDKKSESIDSMGKDFRLVGPDRKVLYEFTAEQIEEDKNKGWMSFQAPLAEGNYFLVYNGECAREIPLYLFKSWQTQVFITFDTKGPVFRSLRILVGRQYNGFVNTNIENLELDALIQKMHNGIYYVPESLIKKAADEKWENPMLAIIVCYAYLLSSNNKFDDLFKTILRNLKERILFNSVAPDLKALELLAARHYKTPLPEYYAEIPCMLRAGMKAFMSNHDSNKRSFIKNESLAEQSMQNMQNDSVWTSYEPLPIINDTPNVEFKITLPDEMMSSKNLFVKPVSMDNADWLTASLFNTLAAKGDDTIQIDKLADQFQVTGSTISQHISYINKLSPDGLQKMAIGLGMNQSQASASAQNVIKKLNSKNKNR
jgi:hypothetical protein